MPFPSNGNLGRRQEKKSSFLHLLDLKTFWLRISIRWSGNVRLKVNRARDIGLSGREYQVRRDGS